MKIPWMVLLFCSLTDLSFAYDIQSLSNFDQSSIAVLVGEQIKTAPFSGVGLRFEGALKTDRKLIRRFSGKIKCLKSKVNFGTLLFSGPIAISTKTAIRFNNNSYPGRLLIYPGAEGCDVVNEVKVETYLEMLVHTEMNVSWPLEAIKAQVIVAKSYLAYKTLNSRKYKRHFDLRATTSDQVYEGNQPKSKRVNLAVKSLENQFLVSEQNGKLQVVQSFYHSSCGGRTEKPWNVWGFDSSNAFAGITGDIYCPYCKVSPKFTWNYPLKLSETKDAIIPALKKDPFVKSFFRRIVKSKLIGIEPIAAPNSYRIQKVNLIFKDTKGEFRVAIRSVALRNWVGPDKIRSTRFQIKHEKDGQIILVGTGSGHGVGLCQWGAKSMAEIGFKADQILEYYYPESKIIKL